MPRKRHNARSGWDARIHSAAQTGQAVEHHNVLASPRFVDRAPAEVVATLLDEGRYLCSERTMYRILAANQPVRERHNQLEHPRYTKPELADAAHAGRPKHPPPGRPPRGVSSAARGTARRTPAHRRHISPMLGTRESAQQGYCQRFIRGGSRGLPSEPSKKQQERTDHRDETEMGNNSSFQRITEHGLKALGCGLLMRVEALPAPPRGWRIRLRLPMMRRAGGGQACTATAAIAGALGRARRCVAQGLLLAFVALAAVVPEAHGAHRDAMAAHPDAAFGLEGTQHADSAGDGENEVRLRAALRF